MPYPAERGRAGDSNTRRRQQQPSTSRQATKADAPPVTRSSSVAASSYHESSEQLARGASTSSTSDASSGNPLSLARREASDNLRRAWDSIFERYSRGDHLAKGRDDVYDFGTDEIIEDAGFLDSFACGNDRSIDIGRFGLPGAMGMGDITSSEDEDEEDDDEEEGRGTGRDTASERGGTCEPDSSEDELGDWTAFTKPVADLAESYIQAKKAKEALAADMAKFLEDEQLSALRAQEEIIVKREREATVFASGGRGGPLARVKLESVAPGEGGEGRKFWTPTRLHRYKAGSVMSSSAPSSSHPYASFKREDTEAKPDIRPFLLPSSERKPSRSQLSQFARYRTPSTSSLPDEAEGTEDPFWDAPQLPNSSKQATLVRQVAAICNLDSDTSDDEMSFVSYKMQSTLVARSDVSNHTQQHVSDVLPRLKSEEQGEAVQADRRDDTEVKAEPVSEIGFEPPSPPPSMDRTRYASMRSSVSLPSLSAVTPRSSLLPRRRAVVEVPVRLRSNSAVKDLSKSSSMPRNIRPTRADASSGAASVQTQLWPTPSLSRSPEGKMPCTQHMRRRSISRHDVPKAEEEDIEIDQAKLEESESDCLRSPKKKARLASSSKATHPSNASLPTSSPRSGSLLPERNRHLPSFTALPTPPPSTASSSLWSEADLAVPVPSSSSPYVPPEVQKSRYDLAPITISDSEDDEESLLTPRITKSRAAKKGKGRIVLSSSDEEDAADVTMTKQLSPRQWKGKARASGIEDGQYEAEPSELADSEADIVGVKSRQQEEEDIDRKPVIHPASALQDDVGLESSDEDDLLLVSLPATKGRQTDDTQTPRAPSQQARKIASPSTPKAGQRRLSRAGVIGERTCVPEESGEESDDPLGI